MLIYFYALQKLFCTGSISLVVGARDACIAWPGASFLHEASRTIQIVLNISRIFHFYSKTDPVNVQISNYESAKNEGWL
jgi:hypothetical protein